jgi:hypothetical protein
LTKTGRPDPRAAGVVHIDQGALVVGEPDDGADLLDRHQIVGDREPGQDDKCNPRLAGDRRFEHPKASGVGKAGPDMVRRAHHRGMAVARRCADHDVARPHQGQMRRQGGTGHAVEHGDVMPVGRPAQMSQCQRPQALEIERRCQLVIGEAKLLAGHRQRMFEPGEDKHRVRSALADQSPSPLQFAKVVLGCREDLAASIRQIRRIWIAKAIGCHTGPCATNIRA